MSSVLLSGAGRLAKVLSLTTLFAAANPVQAQSTVISIDIASGTQNPPFPVLNIRASNSVVLAISPVSRYWRLRPSPCDAPAGTYAEGSQFALNFDATERRKAISRLSRAAESSCVADGSTWFISAHDRRVMTIEVSVDSTAPADALELLRVSLGLANLDALKRLSYMFPLQLEQATFSLDWSAGVVFANLRDQEFRIEPIEGDSENGRLIQVGKDRAPYRLAAFGHYCYVRARWACFAAGFGIDVPVTGLTTMGGFSVRFRTPVLRDSMYLTAGYAYGPRKARAPAFRERLTVPLDTPEDTIVAQKYDIGFFVGLTFGFFGGEEEFKAVYSGKRPK